MKEKKKDKILRIVDEGITIILSSILSIYFIIYFRPIGVLIDALFIVGIPEHIKENRRDNRFSLAVLPLMLFLDLFDKKGDEENGKNN